MTFIIILISLLMERFFHWRHLRHWRWFKNYERWLTARIGNWSTGLIFVFNLLPPLLVVGLLSYVFKNSLFGIPQFIFGVVIILYCLGPENLWLQTYRCIADLHKEDPQIAVSEVQASFGIAAPEHTQEFHKKFVHAIFVAAHQRIFAIVFWFAILGPVGAVLYRMLDAYRAQSTSNLQSMAASCCAGMDWISIRLFTFLFALGGHFTKVFACWKSKVLQGVKSNDALLTGCGLAALDVLDNGLLPETGEAESEAVALLDRVFVMGLVILAVIVLMTSF
jgi:AmpE protein